MIEWWLSAVSIDPAIKYIFSGSQTKHLRQLHWKLKVWAIFWWPFNLYHSGNTDEKPIHVMHMHSTRFRLFSNIQPVTSLLTPSGPSCFGRTLLIGLLSAKSLNIMCTRNTTNLRSPAVRIWSDVRNNWWYHESLRAESIIDSSQLTITFPVYWQCTAGNRDTISSFQSRRNTQNYLVALCDNLSHHSSRQSVGWP